MNRMKESEVLKVVKDKLEVMKLNGDVLWYRRLHNGKFYTKQGTIITMGAKPLWEGKDLDLIIIVNCKNGKIAQLHIDTKRTGVKKLSVEQQIFADSTAGYPMTLCLALDDPKQLGKAIREAQNL